MLYVITFVLGLCWGSFINALVWRLDSLSKVKNVENIKRLSISRGRSMCPKCKHQLSWYDNIPLLSWVILSAKCRYCKKPISWQYPIVELLTAVLFLVSYHYWPYTINSLVSGLLFAVWLIILVLLIALSIYDIRYMLLPNKLIYPLGGLVIIFSLLASLSLGWSSIVSAVVGSIIIGGFFWLLYQISKGKWIGGGDVRYGFIMGALLGWQKAIFGLMLAAYLGTAVIIVLVIIRKYHKRMHLPFGPFLMSATFISLLFGQYFIDLYKRFSGL